MQNQDLLVAYLTNGGLLKTLSIILLFLFAIGAGTIVGYDLLAGLPVNPVLATFLSIVLTHVTNMFAQAQTTGLVTGALLFNAQQAPATGEVAKQA
jgi:hypothetical protein